MEDAANTSPVARCFFAKFGPPTARGDRASDRIALLYAILESGADQSVFLHAA